MNSLPKTVTRQHRSCDLNQGPSAPESSTLTTWLPSVCRQIMQVNCSTVAMSCLYNTDNLRLLQHMSLPRVLTFTSAYD